MYLHKNFKRGSITFPNQIKPQVLNLMMMQHKNLHINEFWTKILLVNQIKSGPRNQMQEQLFSVSTANLAEMSPYSESKFLSKTHIGLLRPELLFVKEINGFIFQIFII